MHTIGNGLPYVAATKALDLKTINTPRTTETACACGWPTQRFHICVDRTAATPLRDSPEKKARTPQIKVNRGPVDYAPRECAGCGKTYKPRQINQRACSSACTQAARLLREKAARAAKRKTRTPKPPVLKRVATCAWCDTQFKARTIRERFCTKTCSNKHQIASRRLPERVIPCEHCGNPFTALTSRARFCTHTCSVAHKIAAKKADRTPRPCDRCGTVFTPYNSRQRFCTHTCKTSDMLANRKQKRATKPKPEQVCGRCGVSYVPRRHDQFCCSKACSKRLYATTRSRAAA